jgi:hypothetical protein
MRTITRRAKRSETLERSQTLAASRRSPQQWQWAATVTLLLALTIWIFKQQLFENWSFPWDFLGTYTTTPAFVADTIGRGHPLSWSPFVASGFPVDVDPQAGLYFPLWWVLGALHAALTLRALTTIQVAHVLFGAVGVLFLTRARRLAWPWASLAAVAYLFFGGFYGQAEHADIFRGFAYLPWLLWSLTPPTQAEHWTRLGTLPLLAWLIVSGAYPGQVVSYGIAGLVYLTVALAAGGAGLWRRYRLALALAAAASAAVCIAVLLPYLHAEHAGELYRTIEPTAAVRSMFALSPIDVFGLYLNNFAWTYEGTITTWAVGIPILIGLAAARSDTLKRHAPLLACGVVALILGMTPKIGFIGQAMTSLRPLFPSRFPASDYKAVVALALIVVSADAWSSLAARRPARMRLAAALLGAALILSALLVPDTHARPTTVLWLVILITVACVALVAIRPPMRVLACLLLVLVVADGMREIHGYRLGGLVSPWQEPPAALSFYWARNDYVRELPAHLARAPRSRPARLPPAATAEPNASGWVADAYHEADYDPTLERVLWQAEQNSAWSSLLLAPWHGYTFPCATVGCGSHAVHLPPPSTWRPSASVQTLSYGTQGIAYTVSLSQPTLMVENELAIPGWHAANARIHTVEAGIPLRAWRLPAGRYHFTATYQEADRSLQELAAAAALLAWLGCVLALRRRSTRSPELAQPMPT